MDKNYINYHPQYYIPLKTTTLHMTANRFFKPGAFKPRLYQETIFNTATQKNTLVVLPTGLGKTLIAAMVAAKRIEEYPEQNIVFVAPTKPLVVQHVSAWRSVSTFNEDEFGVFTGALTPGKRTQAYTDVQIICATPQVIQNDLITGKFNFENTSLLVIDEAHRASGEYPYSFLAQQYQKQSKNPRIVALTASPGSTKAAVDRVCKELFIEAVESYSRTDPEVAPYVKERHFEWLSVDLPETYVFIKHRLELLLSAQLTTLKNADVIPSRSIKSVRKKQLLQLQGELAAKAPQNPDLYLSISNAAAALKLYHAIELLETQGITPLHKYFSGFSKDQSKAAQYLSAQPAFKESVARATLLQERGDEHPKIKRLLGLLSNTDRAIIFAHYRASVDVILGSLESAGISAGKLIGQANQGLSQKKQVALLNDFRAGKFRVLVATSIGEEGLDIPDVDRVIFYEPVPSAIRSIQRAGRTARHKPGRVTILVTKGTRDEAYYWSSRRQEEGMHQTIKNRSLAVKAQNTLDNYGEPSEKLKKKDAVIIFADTRESSSGLLKKLSQMNVEVRVKQLDIADFQLSSRVGVERKTVDDFLQSLLDGRLLTQARSLSQAFEKPILMIEGNSLFNKRNIHPNAIRGSLAALTTDFNIPILYTQDADDTAAYLYVIARREQLDLKKEVQLRSGRTPQSLPDAQQYIIESLPNTGPTLAKRLLEHFKTVEKIMTASELELMEIPKLGDKKVKDIRRVLSSPYSTA